MSVKGLEVGFTGTQHGITSAQLKALAFLVATIQPPRVHHGLCIGGDATFHQVVRLTKLASGNSPRICGHPPINKSKVADFDYADFDELMEPDEYLPRNDAIVGHSGVLIATPKGFEEEVRSGTWYTIRRARSAGLTIFIIFPDGKIKTERPE